MEQKSRKRKSLSLVDGDRVRLGLSFSPDEERRLQALAEGKGIFNATMAKAIIMDALDGHLVSATTGQAIYYQPAA